LLWLFWRWNLLNYLPGLASNSDPPDVQVTRITGMSYQCPAYLIFFIDENSVYVLWKMNKIFKSNRFLGSGW
jgi:hypothetical protein